MAVSGEVIFDCHDCGRKGEDAPKGSMNYLYTVRRDGNTVWLNRCRECHYKVKGVDHNEPTQQTVPEMREENVEPSTAPA